MNRPEHFEYHSNEPEQTLKFWADVFGWQSQRWQSDEHEYWLLMTGEGTGIDGGLMRSRDGQPRTVNTIEVDDVDALAAKVVDAGGQVFVEKMPIPGVGWLVYCTEPAGNIFGMM